MAIQKRKLDLFEPVFHGRRCRWLTQLSLYPPYALMNKLDNVFTARNIAAHAKEKGNDAFRAHEYILAKSLYTHAMRIDPDNHIYPLNRSIANLKLERWEDAILDATKVLQSSPFNLKALFRRSLANKALGHWSDARSDIEVFIAHGGNAKEGAEELEALKHLQSSVPLPTPPSELEESMKGLSIIEDLPSSSSDAAFVLRKSTTVPDGLGAIATRSIKRGEMILSETPVFSIPQGLPESIRYTYIQSAVFRLSPSVLDQYLSLHNSHVKCSCSPPLPFVVGIYHTNAFMLHDDNAGICVHTSRFNHSCSPNARYSFNSRTGEMRVHALADIHEGEEIFVMYIMGRNVYGTPTLRRQAVLKEKYHFTCACSVCSLPAPEREASDRRRTKLTALWNTIPRVPPTQGAERLRTIVQAVRMLKEEGYHADADDYTNDAGVVCSFHSDWESTRYWAEMTYRIRVEEFGEDSPRAEEVREAVARPRSLPMAGMGPVKKFTHIRL